MSNYSIEVQKLYIAFMISDPDLFIRIRNVVDPLYFNQTLRKGVQFLVDYVEDYNKLPDVSQFESMTGLEIDQQGLSALAAHHDWFIDEFGTFAKHKALEIAILESADDIQQGNYDIIQERIKAATSVSISKNMGIDYYDDPIGRLNALKNSNGIISTGLKTLDYKLFGGFNRGELNIIAGGAGAGKSIWLQNLALNYSEAGLNCIYITLELAEGLVGMRLDSMLTGIRPKQIFKQMDDVELKVKMAAKKSGRLQLMYASSGSRTNDIRSMIKEFEIQHDTKIDAIFLDYMDLCMPNDKRVSPSDLFVKDKYVSEEMRNLAKELNTIFVTASQLNRASVESVEYDHSHISGGISKINTADNVMAIHTSATMKERGRIQLQFLKTRNSDGVGTRIDLAFDIATLRITDLSDEELAASTNHPNSESIYDNLKTSKGGKSPKVPDDALKKGNALRNLVSNLSR